MDSTLSIVGCPGRQQGKNVLGEALLDDATELGIGPGESQKLVVIGDLLYAVTVRVDTQRLSETCVTLRDSAFIRALQLLTAFASRWVASRATTGYRLPDPTTRTGDGDDGAAGFRLVT